METYNNSVLPLPPPPLLPQIPPSSSFSKKRGRESDHSYITERDRRLKMTHLFTQLRNSVPGLLPQATREVITNETILYIKELEKKKQKLEELKESLKSAEQEKKRSMLPIPCGNSNRDSSITVTELSSNVVFFGIQLEAQPGLVTLIIKVFCKHQTEILAANVVVNHGKLILAITALVGISASHGNNTVENIKREIMSL